MVMQLHAMCQVAHRAKRQRSHGRSVSQEVSDNDFESTRHRLRQHCFTRSVTERGMFSCTTIAQLVVEVTDASILTVLATADAGASATINKALDSRQTIATSLSAEQLSFSWQARKSVPPRIRLDYQREVHCELHQG